jgi:hypothetical protein
MSQKVRCRRTTVDVNLKAMIEEILENGRELVAFLDVRLTVGGNQIKSLKTSIIICAASNNSTNNINHHLYCI